VTLKSTTAVFRSGRRPPIRRHPLVGPPSAGLGRLIRRRPGACAIAHAGVQLHTPPRLSGAPWIPVGCRQDPGVARVPCAFRITSRCRPSLGAGPSGVGPSPEPARPPACGGVCNCTRGRPIARSRPACMPGWAVVHPSPAGPCGPVAGPRLLWLGASRPGGLVPPGVVHPGGGRNCAGDAMGACAVRIPDGFPRAGRRSVRTPMRAHRPGAAFVTRVRGSVQLHTRASNCTLTAGVDPGGPAGGRAISGTSSRPGRS